MTGLELAAAYARCEEITKVEAKNFAYGIRLLPTPKRQAMSALYAFARRVDDVGDGPGSAADKLVALAEIRKQVESLHAPQPAGDAVLVALGDAVTRYPIPLGALDELVTGCEMDCRQERYETFEDLVVYCRCVAGSIGRLSLGVFGSTDPDLATGLADTLGIGLQVTNILRDIVEDRDVMGRVYLPEQDLARFGCAADAGGPLPALVDLVRFEAGRAKERYAEGLGLLDLLDRRSRACVAAMAGIYRRLLDRIDRDPLAVLDHRVSLPTWEKAWVAARSLAGAGA
ncbi:MAG: hpnD [Acidimicrobiaceae bacterium]|nr:hpnD [Acidimicrobiaceae bacterium]